MGTCLWFDFALGDGLLGNVIQFGREDQAKSQRAFYCWMLQELVSNESSGEF